MIAKVRMNTKPLLFLLIVDFLLEYEMELRLGDNYWRLEYNRRLIK